MNAPKCFSSQGSMKFGDNCYEKRETMNHGEEENEETRSKTSAADGG